MIPYSWAAMLAAGLFATGVLGILANRSALRLLISVELILNAANINFVAAAHHHGNADGLVYTLFVIAIAAAEAAVGLAILIHLFRHARSVDTAKATLLRW
ncbi:MAG TPA: NADH-quinone oxidoreductase subunit NuoK [Candidatus Thermoplasmatota archaeon]|nr:NADH-quinone oxidoreductase subunit NuoK [Candidatus Thermoplasmatota archaeon]